MIVLRPAIEHCIPDAARAVKANLLGDGSRETALLALDECLAHGLRPAHPTTSARPTACDELARLVEAYLDAISDGWIAHLVHVRSRMDHSVPRLRRGLDRIDAQERCSARRRDDEVRRVAATLEDIRAQLRAPDAEPVVRRSPALCAELERLRRAPPSSDRGATPEAVEVRLGVVQYGVAQRFASRALRVLSP